MWGSPVLYLFFVVFGGVWLLLVASMVGCCWWLVASMVGCCWWLVVVGVWLLPLIAVLVDVIGVAVLLNLLIDMLLLFPVFVLAVRGLLLFVGCSFLGSSFC